MKNLIFIGFLLFPLLVWADSGANNFQLTSSAFENNAAIPKKYTCDGQNINPPLMFKNVPANTKSLTLKVSDPDAPSGTWVHWVVYNIPADTTQIPEHAHLGLEGYNGFGKYSYGGPCPPAGKVHHYIFHASALDAQGQVMATTDLVGTYQK